MTENIMNINSHDFARDYDGEEVFQMNWAKITGWLVDGSASLNGITWTVIPIRPSSNEAKRGLAEMEEKYGQLQGFICQTGRLNEVSLVLVVPGDLYKNPEQLREEQEMARAATDDVLEGMKRDALLLIGESELSQVR